MTSHWNQLRSSKNKVRDVFNYILAHYRYYLYYHKHLSNFLQPHIREQIDFRIAIMNPICYTKGSCIHCGCTVTQLQMANKSCEGREYPPMLTEESWLKFRLGSICIINHNTDTKWMIISTRSTSTLKVTSAETNNLIHDIKLPVKWDI